MCARQSDLVVCRSTGRLRSGALRQYETARSDPARGRRGRSSRADRVAATEACIRRCFASLAWQSRSTSSNTAGRNRGDGPARCIRAMARHSTDRELRVLLRVPAANSSVCTDDKPGDNAGTLNVHRPSRDSSAISRWIILCRRPVRYPFIRAKIRLCVGARAA